MHLHTEHPKAARYEETKVEQLGETYWLPFILKRGKIQVRLFPNELEQGRAESQLRSSSRSWPASRQISKCSSFKSHRKSLLSSFLAQIQPSEQVQAFSLCLPYYRMYMEFRFVVKLRVNLSIFVRYLAVGSLGTVALGLALLIFCVWLHPLGCHFVAGSRRQTQSSGKKTKTNFSSLKPPHF